MRAHRSGAADRCIRRASPPVSSDRSRAAPRRGCRRSSRHRADRMRWRHDVVSPVTRRVGQRMRAASAGCASASASQVRHSRPGLAQQRLAHEGDGDGALGFGLVRGRRLDQRISDILHAGHTLALGLLGSRRMLVRAASGAPATVRTAGGSAILGSRAANASRRCAERVATTCARAAPCAANARSATGRSDRLTGLLDAMRASRSRQIEAYRGMAQKGRRQPVQMLDVPPRPWIISTASPPPTGVSISTATRSMSSKAMTCPPLPHHATERVAGCVRSGSPAPCGTSRPS